MKTQSEALIRKAQRGETEAFQELVRKHDRKVLGLAYRMLGNQQDAEDVYQEVFMQVYNNIRKFRFQSAFETWLYRIVVNTAINYRRKRNRHLNRSVDILLSEDNASWDPADHKPLPDRLILNREIREQIDRGLENLTLIQRTIFVLRFYQDFKIKDIAEIVSSSEGTVKNTLFRSIQKMRKQLTHFMQQ